MSNVIPEAFVAKVKRDTIRQPTTETPNKLADIPDPEQSENHLVPFAPLPDYLSSSSLRQPVSLLLPLCLLEHRFTTSVLRSVSLFRRQTSTDVILRLIRRLIFASNDFVLPKLLAKKKFAFHLLRILRILHILWCKQELWGLMVHSILNPCIFFTRFYGVQYRP